MTNNKIREDRDVSIRNAAVAGLSNLATENQTKTTKQTVWRHGLKQHLVLNSGTGFIFVHVYKYRFCLEWSKTWEKTTTLEEKESCRCFTGHSVNIHMKLVTTHTHNSVPEWNASSAFNPSRLTFFRGQPGAVVSHQQYSGTTPSAPALSWAAERSVLGCFCIGVHYEHGENVQTSHINARDMAHLSPTILRRTSPQCQGI